MYPFLVMLFELVWTQSILTSWMFWECSIYTSRRIFVIILQNILLQWIRERAMDRKISLGYIILSIYPIFFKPPNSLPWWFKTSRRTKFYWSNLL